MAAGTVAAQTPSVATFTNLASYAAATSNTAVIGFNGILPSGTSFQSFNPLVVSGVSFATPTAGTSVNVTTANYYSPNNYPGAFIVDAGSSAATETLKITLPSPTFALALDCGQLFGGGAGSITLSNGFTFDPTALPTVGNTAFIGFVSTTPITGLSYVVSGGHWVVEDLRISTPASGGSAPVVSLSLSAPIIPAGQSATLTWSSTNATSCNASGSWSGPQPTNGSQTVSPGLPGYYTYTLTCTGSGNESSQSVVLTAFGPTPGVVEPVNELGYQAAFYVAPPNQIVRLETSLTVPPLPPAGTSSGSSLFLWPGLDPATNSANFLPINNGVLQPVLSWGDSCAPASQPTAFSSWWISAQYVNVFGNDPGYAGCFSGQSMLVNPGDVLLLDIALNATTGVWTQTVTDSNTNKSVTFSINMQGQGQNWAYFAMEAWYGARIFTPVTFSNTTLTFQLPDSEWCSDSQGKSNAYVMTPPTPQNSGTQCFIRSIVLTQPANPGSPAVTGVQNGASFQTGANGVSAGEVISIFGSDLGPALPVTAQMDAAANLATTLGGVEVLVNGSPAPLIYVSSTQVTAVVPYEVAGLQQATLQVTYLNQKSNVTTLAVTNTSPAIFTLNSSGTGPGARDADFIANGPNSPAAKGSTVIFFLTGEGLLTPAGVTGKINPINGNAAAATLPVAVLIGNQPANWTYAAGIPGVVEGIMQLNVMIPNNVLSGIQPVLVTIGGNATQSGVTVAVK